VNLMTESLKHAALLVIDVQMGMFAKSTKVYRAEQLIRNITSLVRAAQKAGVPVIFIQHSGEKDLIRDTPGWQFHPELLALGPDALVHKQHGNAFEETELDQILKARGVEQVVVTGMVTHGCVKNTCLGGLAAGYRVILVADAHSSYSQKAGELIAEWNARLQQQGAGLKTTEEIAF
jgi:nicotinamidase-related amidase